MEFIRRSLSRAGSGERKASWRSSKWFIQTTVAMAVFTDIFLYALIIPVMPFALESKLMLEQTTIQPWISVLIAVYGGALAIASPVCGWASDKSSNRKAPLLAGLIALTGATVLLHVGPTVGVLVLARILQGISAAVVWVVGLALLADTVPRAELGQAMGGVFAAMSLGVLVAPLAGGAIFQRFGFNAVFLMAYLFLAIDLVLRFLMVEQKDLKEARSLDNVEVVEMPSGHLSEKAIAEKLRKDRLESIDSSMSDAGTMSRASSFRKLLVIKKKPVSPEDCKPNLLTLLQSRRLMSCLTSISVAAILMSQFDSVLPLYVKNTFGWESTAAGLIFLPITLTAFLSPIVGWGIDKYGPRWFAFAGFLALVPFQVLLRLVDENTLKDKILLCVFLTMIGICFDLTTPTLLVEITAVVEAKETEHPGIFGKTGAMAQAYGLFNTAWAIGSLIGPIWSGFIVSRGGEGSAGWKLMTWTMALLSFVVAIPTAIYTGGCLFDAKKRQRPQKVVVVVDVEQGNT